MPSSIVDQQVLTALQQDSVRYPRDQESLMPPSSLPTLLCSTLLLCTAACNPADGEGPHPPAEDPLSWSIEEPGPYQVGFSTWEITYTPHGSTDERTVPISVWYPSTDLSGEGVTYEFIFPDDQSWLNASPAPSAHDGGYPVLAYSHGNQGFAGSSSFLMRTFASHGWVAVAPDHLGNTLSTHSSPRPLSLWLNRGQDISVAFDSLEERAPQLLGGVVDSTRSIVSGHSFGGYTTWSSMGAAYERSRIEQRCDDGVYPPEQCTPNLLNAFEDGVGDDRFAAGLPLAGKGSEDWFGMDGLNVVDRPMLQMSGSLDAGAVAGVWERTEEVDLTWVDIEGGCHQLFALGACDEVPTADGFFIVSTYALAFARHHALDDVSEDTLTLLDGSRLLSDRVTLQRH